jgi:hypothetical protein
LLLPSLLLKIQRPAFMFDQADAQERKRFTRSKNAAAGKVNSRGYPKVNQIVFVFCSPILSQSAIKFNVKS